MINKKIMQIFSVQCFFSKRSAIVSINDNILDVSIVQIGLKEKFIKFIKIDRNKTWNN